MIALLLALAPVSHFGKPPCDAIRVAGECRFRTTALNKERFQRCFEAVTQTQRDVACRPIIEEDAHCIWRADGTVDA